MSQTGQWILLVEDDPEVALLLGDGLREAGLRVIFAHSVQEAHSKLQRQRFDGVVLDMCLAHGSGEEVIGAMRTVRGFNSGTPVLVVSAMLDAPLVKRIRSQVHGMLVKPFNLGTLVQRVFAMLEESREASPVAPGNQPGSDRVKGKR